MPDPFFPKNRTEEAEALVNYCLGCPVTEDCDQYAEKIRAPWGIWGGKKRSRENNAA